jgi:hypothetical protein
MPAWRPIDLRKYADSQSFAIYHWSKPLQPQHRTLLRFYMLCLGCGALLLLRVGWVSVYVTRGPREFSKQTLAFGLAAAAVSVMAVVWVAAPQILAPEVGTPQLVAMPEPPKLVLDPLVVVAGSGSYTLKIAALANEGVRVRYSLNGGATEEMGMALDANGAIHLEVAAHTRKGVYRMLAFKRPQDELWVESDAVLTVK